MLQAHPTRKVPYILKGDSCLVTGRLHTGPMHSFLKRNGLGSVDQYGRGIWIHKRDLKQILASIKAEPSAIECGRDMWNWSCNGSNIHNSVEFVEFLELFGLYERWGQNDPEKIISVLV